MVAVEITGLESLDRRLANLARLAGLEPALREEAEAVAAEARARLASHRGSGELARSVEIFELGEGDSPTFGIGTPDPAGRQLEFGTRRMRAYPWLLPVLFGRSRAVNRKFGKVVSEALQAMRKA